MWKTVREELLDLLFAPRDEAPGHERRTVLIVVYTIVLAVIIVAIALAAYGYL